jgi:hypothetical protein
VKKPSCWSGVLDDVLQRDGDQEGEIGETTTIRRGQLRYTSTDLSASLAYVSARLLLDLRGRG